MLQLNLVDTKQTIEVSEENFGQAFNEPLVHQVVTAYMAAARAGTHAQKTRSEVRGGGKKPWRQKGTGRARAGTIRSPLWRGGGIIFAAKQRDYSQKVNKKMYRSAIRSIVSELIRQERLHIVESLKIEQPKTKVFISELNKLNIKENALIVVSELDDNLYLSSRNIPHVEVCDIYSLNPVSLIKYDNIIMTLTAIKKLEEQLG